MRILLLILIIFLNTFLQAPTTANQGHCIKVSDLKKNMRENCIPVGIFDYDVKSCENFLVERKHLLAKKIKGHYEGL